MNDNEMPYKEISLLVFGRKMHSVIFGNWVNPERAIFIFTGNLGTWLTNINDLLIPPSSPRETYAAKAIKSCSPNNAYIFFNRLGYQYSDPSPELFFVENIPQLNDAIRNIILEAIEQSPREIINFGHSYGGFCALVDMILGSINTLEAIDRRTNPGFLVANDRQKHHWIIVDPFLANKDFYFSVFGKTKINIMISLIVDLCSSLSMVTKNKDKAGFFLRPVANYYSKVFEIISDTFAYLTNNYKNFFLRQFGMDPNFTELLDSFSFERQKNCLDLLAQNKGKMQLHVIGIFTPPDIKEKEDCGFVTYPICKKQILGVASLSKYSNSYLELEGNHTYMTTNPNGYEMFRQILEFTYNNRDEKVGGGS